MVKKFYFPFLLLILIHPGVGFKTSQLKNARVKVAFTEKESMLLQKLESKGVQTKRLKIFLRVFKREKRIEAWAKNWNTNKFVKITEYAICANSGTLGPKRRAGDEQVPEGFYFIERFNPMSNFYLSLGLSYPNASDRKFSHAADLGGDIFIHGSCVTIGCMPITDDKIKELYTLCVLAQDAGQINIPVHIFPCKLTKESLDSLRVQFKLKPDNIRFWENLKLGYEYFESKRELPKVFVRMDGYYIFQ
ncbi:MAG: L,D-transpeptidase family protein [Bacteroidetes bacterium]|nr:L,D-transpeptidase family protein [Bacteroidota bacterium]